jgi:hypothetical protein
VLAFEYQGLDAAAPRLDRRRHAGDAGADDQQIGLEIPAPDLAARQRRCGLELE